MDESTETKVAVSAPISLQKCAEAEFDKYNTLFGEQPPDPCSVDKYLDDCGVQEMEGAPQGFRFNEDGEDLFKRAKQMKTKAGGDGWKMKYVARLPLRLR